MEGFNIIRSVQSGVGVVQLHKLVNQTQDFGQISTAPHPIGHAKINGTYIRRFGNVVHQRNTEFDYPRGAPGVYAQSKPGTAGLGNLGEGSYNSGGHDSEFKPAADLLEAQGIVNREVHADGHFARPEHFHYEDRTKLALQERFVDMDQDYTRKKIQDLLSKGFTEEEIAKKIDKDREKAIEKAEKMPMNPQALMAAQIAKQIPDELREDFPIKTSPGGIPTPRDTSAYQRATDSAPLVNRQKKYQAMNREMKLSGQVNYIQPPIQTVEEEQEQTTKEVVSRVAREHASEKQKIHGLEERAMEQQHMYAKEVAEKEAAMAKAMGGGYDLRPRGRGRPPLPEGVKGVRRTKQEMEEARMMGAEDKPKPKRGGMPKTVEDVRAMAVKEQVPLSAFMQLPGLMKQSAGAGLEGVEAEHLAAKMKKGMFE